MTDAKKAGYDQRKRGEAFMASLREEYGKKIEANIRKQANTEAAG